MIDRLIADAADTLGRMGAGNPRFEAELLLGHALQRPRIFLFTHPEHEPSDVEQTRFGELLGRRLSGEPLQYVLGTAAFRDLTLRVRPGIAIPRCETEVLVEIAWERLRCWRERNLGQAAFGGHAARADSGAHAGLPARGPGRKPPAERRPWVIDVGVGSGAILLALMFEAAAEAEESHSPDHKRETWFRPLGVDLSPHAIEVTAGNARSCGLPEPCLLHADLLSAIGPAADVAAIVSNPPYVTSAEMRALPCEIREYEPPVALHGGPDGLAVIRELLDQSIPFVERGTLLCFEIGATQDEALRAELAGRGLLELASIHRDLAGRPRVVVVEPSAPQDEVRSS
jgi:release factor glutamine methyltransferase